MLADKLAELKQGALNDVAEAQEKVALVEGMESDLVTEKKAEYDQGFNDGLAQAGQANGSDKLYSDAEMEAELAPLKAQIAALEAEKLAAAEALPAQLQAAADQAKAELKSELKAKYEEQQVAEAQGETGFGALLS